MMKNYNMQYCTVTVYGTMPDFNVSMKGWLVPPLVLIAAKVHHRRRRRRRCDKERPLTTLLFSLVIKKYSKSE